MSRKEEQRGHQLTKRERRRLLQTLDETMRQPPTRPQAEVARELRDLRNARHQSR